MDDAVSDRNTTILFDNAAPSRWTETRWHFHHIQELPRSTNKKDRVSPSTTQHKTTKTHLRIVKFRKYWLVHGTRWTSTRRISRPIKRTNCWACPIDWIKIETCTQAVRWWKIQFVSNKRAILTHELLVDSGTIAITPLNEHVKKKKQTNKNTSSISSALTKSWHSRKRSGCVSHLFVLHSNCWQKKQEEKRKLQKKKKHKEANTTKPTFEGEQERRRTKRKEHLVNEIRKTLFVLSGRTLFLLRQTKTHKVDKDESSLNSN